jgi:hypothetical protein
MLALYGTALAAESFGIMTAVIYPRRTAEAYSGFEKPHPPQGFVPARSQVGD